VFAVFAGFLIPFVMVVGIWLAVSAHNASNDAHQAAVSAKAASAGTSSTSMPGMSTQATAAGAVATPSFAGTAPANADALAMSHAAAPATLPAAPAGSIARVTLDIRLSVVSIAPGIRYEAWTFGNTAPGPIIHVRVGQTVRVTLHNSAPMAHSVDFHAAEVAPNQAFSDVQPGQSKTFSFVAKAPGVFMYHCGTVPAFVHVANGMYGAIVVEPRGLPKADREYVLVSSEWYLNKAGLGSPAGLDLTKAEQMTPDWVTWNGYASQYKTHPLAADRDRPSASGSSTQGRVSTQSSTSSAPSSGAPG
jgi:nitrite reductase (NO-forming)